MSDPSKSSLSPNRRRLLKLMQCINFGRIENLQVRDGDPVLDPLPRVVRRKKNGGNNQPRAQVDASDFALKREWIEFFEDLGTIGDGVILSIEVSHGLPIIHEFEDVIHV